MGTKVKVSKRVKRGWTTFDLPDRRGGAFNSRSACLTLFLCSTTPWSQGRVGLEPNVTVSQMRIIYSAGTRQFIPLGIEMPCRQFSIYKSSQMGIQGKEGECGGWILWDEYPMNPTLPLNLHVPQGEQKRQATAPARALKDRNVKVEPKKRSSDLSQTWPRRKSSRGNSRSSQVRQVSLEKSLVKLGPGHQVA